MHRLIPSLSTSMVLIAGCGSPLDSPDAGPVLDEWGAPPPRARPVTEPGRLRGPRPLAPLGKKRMNVGYVPPNARAASARRGTHVRDSGGVISGGRVTDYF